MSCVSETFDVETLGERVLRARLEKGMTQSVLARAIGVEPATIGNLEVGRTRALKLGKMPKLAEVLGISLVEVMSLAAGKPFPTDRYIFELSSEDHANLLNLAKKHGFPTVGDYIRYLSTTAQSGAVVTPNDPAGNHGSEDPGTSEAHTQPRKRRRPPSR